MGSRDMSGNGTRMARPIVLLTDPATEAVARDGAGRFDVIRRWELTDAELRARGPLVRGVATAGGRVDAALMDRLPHLEIVAVNGVGYDCVDVAEAARRGVVVTNTPGVLTDDVADTALGLLLMVVRELPQAERHLRAGRWSERAYRLAPTTVRGRTLGVLGLGRIGEAIARRAVPFGMEVCYHNRRPRTDVPFRYCATLAELADRADTLVVAAPGGPETRHLVDAEVLRRLGGRGIVVNVARGSVIDEAALVAALRSGTILGAGLDVYESAPPVSADLLDLPNAVLLPHVGSATEDTRRAMCRLVVDNLAGWFEHGTAATPVPETPAPAAGREHGTTSTEQEATCAR